MDTRSYAYKLRNRTSCSRVVTTWLANLHTVGKINTITGHVDITENLPVSSAYVCDRWSDDIARRRVRDCSVFNYARPRTRARFMYGGDADFRVGQRRIERYRWTQRERERGRE